MSTFELLPAIDLHEGGVVRLRQGDFAQASRYALEPAAVGRSFVADGAAWLHVVDLDGARAGEPRQLEILRAIAAAVPAGRVEAAGGIRTHAAAEAVLAAGAARIVVGTAALRDPGFAAELVARHGALRVAAAIDVRDGLALGEGWRAGAPGMPAAEAVARLADAGIATFEVTAIDRDGLLGGPDLALLGELVSLGRGAIVASGGVASIGDLLATRAAGCTGAIVGRALYEGRLDLAAAAARLAAGDTDRPG